MELCVVAGNLSVFLYVVMIEETAERQWLQALRVCLKDESSPHTKQLEDFVLRSYCA